MEYKLVVTRFEKNPKFSTQRDQYDRRPEELEYTTYSEILNVCLCEPEFIAIKKAVIEVIK